MVVGNHLAQHRELSLTAIGLATHIFSVPEGTPVDIRSLAERFPEGRDRIAFALRELEAHGYLERVREHTTEGRLVTRTYAHHAPLPARVAVSPAPTPVRVAGRTAVPRTRTRDAATGADVRETSQEDDQATAEPVTPVTPVTPTEPANALASEDPPRDAARRDDPLYEKAVALLAGLRRTDERLALPLRDVNRPAPGVVDRFERDATAAVHRTLTADLPAVMKHPAGVIAYRLRALLPPPLPAVPTPPPGTVSSTSGAHRPPPFQDCDGCGRVFRAPEPGRCRDCRSGPMAMSEGACVA
ncbi:helix-turn-helix domain-containing protein [Streptomyces sp. NPDC058632]|uniref:helix-turn-helix domain-containing protein n=1 Tax=Streptomyces sp. NPDC058632 TaxID=3346567 RepID=UPI0036572025